MARDYKNAGAASKRKNGRPVGSWASFTSGLALGLVVAFAVYVWRDQVPSFEQAIERGPLVDDGEYESTEISTTEVEAPTKRKFDFYNILPQIEVKVPDWEITSPSEEQAADEQAGTFVFQVGSFKHHDDADRAKAQLALSGIEAKIHRVVINGQDVWYRVHVGPFTSMSDIQGMRKQLIEAERDFIVLKISDA